MTLLSNSVTAQAHDPHPHDVNAAADDNSVAEPGSPTRSVDTCDKYDKLRLHALFEDSAKRTNSIGTDTPPRTPTRPTRRGDVSLSGTPARTLLRRLSSKLVLAPVSRSKWPVTCMWLAAGLFLFFVDALWLCSTDSDKDSDSDKDVRSTGRTAGSCLLP